MKEAFSKRSWPDQISWKRMHGEISMNPSIIDEDKLIPWNIESACAAQYFERTGIASASAIISIANYDLQFKKTLLSSIIYPSKDSFPIYNTFGVYGCRLMFNGCSRLLELDDYLLHDSKSKLVYLTKRKPIGNGSLKNQE